MKCIAYLEAPRLYNYIDVKGKLTPGAIISPLFLDRFGCSLRFCHLEFVIKPFLIGCSSENRRCFF